MTEKKAPTQEQIRAFLLTLAGYTCGGMGKTPITWMRAIVGGVTPNPKIVDPEYATPPIIHPKGAYMPEAVASLSPQEAEEEYYKFLPFDGGSSFDDEDEQYLLALAQAPFFDKKVVIPAHLGHEFVGFQRCEGGWKIGQFGWFNGFMPHNLPQGMKKELVAFFKGLYPLTAQKPQKHVNVPSLARLAKTGILPEGGGFREAVAKQEAWKKHIHPEVEKALGDGWKVYHVCSKRAGKGFLASVQKEGSLAFQVTVFPF